MIEYSIDERMNPNRRVKLKNVKLHTTIRVTRIVNGQEMVINAQDFDPRLHERIETTVVDTAVPVPQTPQVRTIPMSRSILEAMTLEELRSLPQFAQLDSPQKMTTKAKAVTALLVLCGIEKAEVDVATQEAMRLAELESNEEAAPAPKKKPAAKKAAPKKDSLEG